MREKNNIKRVTDRKIPILMPITPSIRRVLGKSRVTPTNTTEQAIAPPSSLSRPPSAGHSLLDNCTALGPCQYNSYYDIPAPQSDYWIVWRTYHLRLRYHLPQGHMTHHTWYPPTRGALWLTRIKGWAKWEGKYYWRMIN